VREPADLFACLPIAAFRGAVPTGLNRQCRKARFIFACRPWFGVDYLRNTQYFSKKFVRTTLRLTQCWQEN
jgi:hypothetical protein